MLIEEFCFRELKGDVNVARVDVPANRDLGSRFQIKGIYFFVSEFHCSHDYMRQPIAGFPTLLFLSKGKVYKFQGPRNKETLLQFAREGYKTATGDEVPKKTGFFEGITTFINRVYQGASRDITNKQYFTANTFVAATPGIFVLLLGILFVALTVPGSQSKPSKQQSTDKAAKKSD